MLPYKPLRRSVVWLICATIVHAPATAQVPAAAPRTESQSGSEIKIVILDGNNAMNSVRTRTAVQPVVEVRDEFDRPLSGVNVTFHLPAAGPGGSFPGGEFQQQTVTNRQGQATTRGMVTNTEIGRFHIKVVARRGDSTAAATVAQQNVDVVREVKTSSSSNWWKYLLIAGAAGGAAGALAITRGGGTSGTAAAPSTLTITPGNISVGGPR